jgi:uncharacterized cupredoxin-like copper-binding protein
MLRISLLVLAATALWAQTAAQKGPEPPPEVDKALRARINEFCELHKQGKFRQAEQFVADDTKDYYYNSSKPHYVSYEIQSIKYNEDFTQALATVICEQYLSALGFQNQTIKMLTPFNWKLENGQWMWFVLKDTMLVTPFGRMTPAEHTDGASAPPAGGASPRPPVIPASVDQFFAMIKADKNELTLKPGASGEVTISNGTPGMIIVGIARQFAGVEAKLDVSGVPAGGKAVLTVHAGDHAASGVIRLDIKPIGPPIAVRVKIE